MQHKLWNVFAFFIASNIFIYFLILYNAFKINWGPNDFTVRCILWFFTELIIIIITRCFCSLKDESRYEYDDYLSIP